MKKNNHSAYRLKQKSHTLYVVEFHPKVEKNKFKKGEGINVISEGKNKRQIVEITEVSKGKFRSVTKHEKKGSRGGWIYSPKSKLAVVTKSDTLNKGKKVS